MREFPCFNPSKSCYANYKTGGLLSSYLSPFYSTSYYYFSEGFQFFCFSHRFSLPPKSLIFQHPQILHDFEGSKRLHVKIGCFGHNPYLNRRNCERSCRNCERSCRNYERNRRNFERDWKDQIRSATHLHI
jgi:hypothetical protein